MMTCSLCGHSEFVATKVLWPELIEQWQLSSYEASYIDEQQGTHCVKCGANLRINALADALREMWQTDMLLSDFVRTERAQSIKLLDMNGSQALSTLLSQLPGYVRADYPAVDIHALPFADGQFDAVVHSDTLEHVAVPIRALEECKRVLSKQGHLCFTVPIIVGRMSRSRAGLPRSYHGDMDTAGDDFRVQSEFGVDIWTIVAMAGFKRIMFNHVRFPAALAISAW
jgi:SAM-dependent methyltransferase